MQLGHANRIAAVLLALVVWTPAFAAEVEIERMTWPEVAAALKDGKTTILIPTGGTEQNGPHLVLGKHNFIVRETARRIAEKLGDALVAPVLAYTPEGDISKREGHMAYAGTISIPPNAFAQVLESTVYSLAAHGFKQIVFLGDSGPNQLPQKAMAEELSARLRDKGISVMNAHAYYAENGQTEALVAEGETEATIGKHAGIRDTSELLAIAPDGVRLDKRVADKDGVDGDPGRASAERGEKLIGLKVEAAVKEIRALRTGTAEPKR